MFQIEEALEIVNSRFPQESNPDRDLRARHQRSGETAERDNGDDTQLFLAFPPLLLALLQPFAFGCP
jgi:hypothetical protein